MTSCFRYSVAGALALAVSVLGVITAPVAAQQAPAAKTKTWVVPRTPDGKPDLQGNWTNETQTLLERMGPQGATLTNEQAGAIEKPASRRASPEA